MIERHALAVASLVFLAACSEHKAPSPGQAAAAAGDLQSCINSTEMQACFETLTPMKVGNEVKVKARIVDTLRACPSDQYCQCVTAQLDTGGAGESATRCARTFFNRPARGAGPWAEASFDFGKPVKSVESVNYGSTRPGQAPRGR